MILGKKQSEKPWTQKAIYGFGVAATWMRTRLHEGWAIGMSMNLAPTGLEPYSSLSPWMQTSYR